MMLASRDGTMVELSAVGYQFPQRSAAPEDERDWDANWLLISGTIRTSDSQQWKFTDPCLTTWEAAGLSGWLAAAAAHEPGITGKTLSFTEPNLELTTSAYDGEHSLIQIRFSHESLPPWMPRDFKGWQAAEYLLSLQTTRDQLRDAAQTWDREHKQFPQR
jgi:hypothetical protein